MAVDRVSIIIPIYNVAPYIKECLESVIGQSYTDLEILCIDDCSTDDSMLIVQMYSAIDSRIKIIHHEQNRGLAISRNTGLENASGKYFFFLDSDDYLVPNAIEKLVQTSKTTNSDIVLSQTNTFTLNNTLQPRVMEVTEYLHTAPIKNFQITVENYQEAIETIPCVSWGKLFTRDFLIRNKLKFIDKNIAHEDDGFNLMILSRFPRITVIDDIGVHYRIRENSITDKMEKRSEKKKKLQHMRLSLSYTFSYIKKTHSSTVANTLIRSIKSSKFYCRYYEYSINLLGVVRIQKQSRAIKLKIFGLTFSPGGHVLSTSKISIIIPFYNTCKTHGSQQFLRKNIESILNQTYKDLEILYIDNNSNDESVDIIKSYNDPRIKILTQNVQGVSNARNLGIEHATGEYLTFIDSDDYVAKDYIETALKDLKGIDVFIRELLCCYQGNTPPHKTLRKKGLKLYGKHIQDVYPYMECLPNVFFRTNFIKNKNIRFDPNISIGEDNLFITTSIVHAKNVKIRKKANYYYQILGTSSSNSSGNYLSFIEAYDKIFAMGLERFGYINDACVNYFLTKYPYFYRLSNNKEEFKKQSKLLLQKYINSYQLSKGTKGKMQNLLRNTSGITSGDISVIVQGGIHSTETRKCLESVRLHLPNAEIILSTWEGSDLSTLQGLYDILVLNADPGAPCIRYKNNNPVYNNMNRQLFSTQEGLKKATRKYAMKLRSDLIITDDRFLAYIDKFPARSENYNLFTNKILTSSLLTRFSLQLKKNLPKVDIPFHISDWWFFGLREDLNTYFLHTPLAEEPNFTQYFNLEKNTLKNTPYGTLPFKFAPEQYFGYTCFAQHFSDIHMEDAADNSQKVTAQSRECIINNFIILDFEQSGIYLNKYPYSKNEKFLGEEYLDLYNFARYENEYTHYCDKEYKITSNENFYLNEKLWRAKLRIYKHIFRLKNKQEPLSRRLEQIFIGIPFSIIAYVCYLIKNTLKTT